jgi:four helix bundle protein
MTNTFHTPLLPHHRLRAYGLAVELLQATREARIRDRVLRDQALRAAKSACLNCAEGAGRFTRAD